MLFSGEICDYGGDGDDDGGEASSFCFCVVDSLLCDVCGFGCLYGRDDDGDGDDECGVEAFSLATTLA